MDRSIQKLLSIASDAIAPIASDSLTWNQWGPLGNELVEVLRQKNGFYAYESALLVRPLANAQPPLGVLAWNAPTLWKQEYTESLADALFFAEDVFSGQFCIHQNRINSFDPETGLFGAMADSLSEWAHEVTANYPIRTGYLLAHEWQTANRPLLAGTRLLPKLPFACGGKYEIDNLHPVSDVKGMQFRASIANHIRDLPDGSRITIKSLNDVSLGK